MYRMITDEVFTKISNLVHSEIGINLPDKKKQMVNSRLSSRLRLLGLTDYQQYYNFLQKNRQELRVIYNLLTTNVTHFYREEYHFQYIKDKIIPVLQAKENDDPVYIWSAGCSSGEEPYSLAIMLRENINEDHDVKILGSDINTEVLAVARKGIYSYQQVNKIPYDLLKKYFRLGQGKNKGLFKVRKQVREMVKFKEINLNKLEGQHFSNKFDIIFCRNVFIYFPRETRQKILNYFYNLLNDNGYLFLGHSESISRIVERKSQWKLVYKTTYQKCQE
ncbi:MAG: CheR family methyltransferase [Halothermotrichaceae bacterium]